MPRPFTVHTLQVVNVLEGKIEKLLLNSDNGRLLKEGISTVIVGKPNAGKSSLLNTLVGEERSIVTDIAGTTRDIIEEQINLNGIILNVIDTAGIRETKDVVERIGVEKAKRYLNDADLVIYVVDSSTELDENDFEILNQIKGHPALILLNKSDLETFTTTEDILSHVDNSFGQIPVILPISAKEQKGIERLTEEIKKMFFKGEVDFNDEVYVTNVRQKAALQEALGSMRLVRKSIEEGMPEDFFSIDLMDAYERLGSIIGEAVEEDLINEIFGQFCNGK